MLNLSINCPYFCFHPINLIKYVIGIGLVHLPKHQSIQRRHVLPIKI